MRSFSTIDRPRIAELRGSGEFFWLDLHAPTHAQLDELGELFGYHELALEDSREFGQRPKLDAYGDHVLLVYYGLDGDDLVEVHIYVSGEAIVTVRHGHCRTLVAAHERLELVDAKTEEDAVYRVLDALTDSYFPTLDRIDGEIEQLEEQLFDDPDDGQRARIFGLRRQLVELRRVVGPQRDIFAAGGGRIEALPGLSVDEAHDAFRDVYDHLLRIGDTIDGQRELLSQALDLHVAAVSNRVNRVTKQLTLIASIFLPLTFLTGFFGQNFGWLVEHVDTLLAFLVYGVGGLLLSAGALFVYFRRSGFFKT